MDVRSPRSSAVERVADRRFPSLVSAAILVGAALIVAGAPVAVPSSLPLPVVVGLAARGGADREADLERLATELEGFVDRLRADRSPDESERATAAADAAFDLDRSDELGRLAAAVDELTTAVARRERRFAARERELRESNERLEAIIEASPAALVALDTDETVTLWNPAAERIFGWRETEVLGEPLPFVPDDRVDDHDEIMDRLLEGETIAGRETQRTTRGGDRIDVSVSAAPIRDADGEIVGTMGALEDITDRKERERRLEATSARLEALFENSPDMIDVLDTDGTIVDANRRLCEALGYAEAELVGSKIWEHELRFDADEVRALLDDTAVGERRKFEGRFRRQDGSTFPIEVHLIRIDLEDANRFVAICRDVSERKRYERDLERTTELLEQAQRLASVGGWELDVREEPYDVRWTDEVARIHGLPPAGDVDLERALECYRPDDRERLRAAVEDAIADGESYDLELRMTPVEGEERWVRTIGEPVAAADGGDVVKLQGAFQDVTDRKRRERELERYETIIQAIGDPVYALDASGEFRFVNDAIEQLAGYDPEALIGSDVSEVMRPENLETARRLVGELRREDRSYETFEMALETADGDVVETENHMALLPSEDGGFAGTAGVVRDITDRKERERELERYETIIQAVGDPVYTLDASGTIRFINDAIERLAGYDPEALIGSDVSAVLPPPDLERAREQVRELLREDKPYGTVETDFATADGGVIETETHIALLPSEDGEFAGTAGVVRDITDRKERERELERATDLLERVQRMAKVGGWELDVDDDPRTAIWTDEMYRLHDLPPGVAPDLDRTVECYHPDDRPFVRDRLETAIETETGYDFEARIRTSAGDVRWVRTISEPIYDDDGELRKYRGTVQDITDRKRRELALESLHETARGLLNAETESTVADLVVDTAADLLESGDADAGVYLLESETNRFEPVASTAGFAARSGGAPSIAVGDGDSVLWNTYVTGSQTVVDDAAVGDRSPLFGGAATGGLLVPIGDHGVFVLVASPDTIDDETRRLFETLVATTEAAFDRLESEASLRERDAELAARNRRLRRQIQVTEIIRGIDRSLIGTDGRDEIERTVPRRLVEADNVAFAWIGDLDPSGSTLEARTWAGDEPEYLDALAFDLEGDSSEPAVRAARSETPTVVENVVEGLQRESWRRTALDAGFQSVVAVPLTFEEYSYGVLTVYADEPGAFTDLERTVFAELGEGIANAINAAQTQEALHAETLVELTLDLEADDVLARIAAATDAAVTYEGLGTHGGSETVLFFEISDASADDVRDALADLVSVTDFRLITDTEEGCLFEATVTGDVLASRLVRHGGSPRSIAVEDGRTAVTVDVPVSTDVREFVEMLADRYDDVDLRSRRHVQRAMQTRGELVTSLFDDLTDRQLEVLRTAYLAGFFEWPRESTGEEIAEMLDVTQPTVNRHLRIGQQRLLSQLFENETLSLVDAS